jgi:hypothetical protein
MGVKSTTIYEARSGEKLNLPQTILDNISKLRLKPAPFRQFRQPFRPVVRQRDAGALDNWRENLLRDYVRRVKEYDDPEYSEIFAIFNKIGASNMDKLSLDVLAFLKKRDENFRLRVTTLLFDKAVTKNAYSAVMADCSYFLGQHIPAVNADLLSQIDLFPKLYNMTETLTFPSATDNDFDDKVILWMKQKETRRGYSKFMTHLFIRGIVPEETISKSLINVFEDLNEVSRQTKTSQSEENTTHLVDFLYECSKILPKTSGLRQLVIQNGNLFLGFPRAELPSLCMRSRFKMEDAMKLCVQE